MIISVMDSYIDTNTLIGKLNCGVWDNETHKESGTYPNKIFNFYYKFSEFNENSLFEIHNKLNSCNFIDITDKADYICENNIPIQLPEKPSEYHVFDFDQNIWIDTRTVESQWLIVKAKRNELLNASDWTQMPDVSIPTKEAWAVYRKELRDITNQLDPFNIIWPTPPN